MLYKPQQGGIWDPSILYKDGKYQMFCMYFKDGEVRRDDYMWRAVSEDGVHWQDVGVVLEDKQGVCKMFLYETPEGTVADFGSFSDPSDRQHNDRLRYYISKDLTDWEYVGENAPDARWYRTDGRWDHMYVLKEGDTYYGYPVATPLPEQLSCMGLCVSKDGLHWEVQAPPRVEWGDIPPIDCLECGGVEKIGNKYYFIGGYIGYAGNYGYGVYTFIADKPEGPFRPDKEAFRLCGFDRLPGRVFVQNLAAFCRGKDGELLIGNAADGGDPHRIWLLPLRKAVTDAAGHLCQGYWPGNEALKGEALPCPGLTIQPLAQPAVPADWLPVAFKTGAAGFTAHTEYPDHPNIEDRSMVIAFEKTFDLETGVIIEGDLTAQSCPAYDEIRHRTLQWRPASFGFWFGEAEGGMDIAAEIGHPYHRHTVTEVFRTQQDIFKREIIDTIGENCAGVRGIPANKICHFRIFARHNLFEVYMDELHLQTFVHLGTENGRLGFTLQNAVAKVENLRLWKMSL